MLDTWAVFAGPAWPAGHASPEAHLVGVFPSFLAAHQAFGQVIFRPLAPRHGHARWRGHAPFGASIVQIERLTPQDRLLKRRRRDDDRHPCAVGS